ncbi:tetratricopeptide repeat protein [Cognataquiflexum rubidum]|uniref:tetratricopeptide repeat protein n=1 Tax=Cognataquiflexum rubidum TaxID=2922273 RepID=UPI001F137EBC|nr:tetratricopeptide repeat protein [Cognataquiflexum rubidum]
MTIQIKKILSISLLLLISFGAFSQEKLSKKERKKQLNEAQASRLFIDGQRYLMQEDFDRAYFYFQKARELSPEQPAINFKIAEILLRANQVDKALEFGMKAVELDPDNKYYNLVMAEVYSKQNQPKKAAAILEKLMANTDENQNYILDLASLYLAGNEFDKALEALTAAEDYYGLAPQITLQKQKIFLRKNDLKSAIQEGEKLIDSQPGNSLYVINLVEILFNNGKTDEAIQQVEKSLAAYPNQPDLQMAAYALYKDKGDIDKAEELIKSAFANPDLEGPVKAQAFAGILQEPKSARRDDLIENLSASMLANHPNDADILTILGDKKLFEGDREGALELYRQSLTINPANAQVLQGVITTMFELGKEFTEIEELTSTAVGEFPDRAEFWFFDGTAKLAVKKGEEAETSLNKALEINNGKNPQLDLLINGQLGDAYHLTGKSEKAFEAYEAVLKVRPDDEHVLNNYAYYLSLAKKDLEKAKSMSSQLVKRFPKNATYLDTHAWVLFQLKDYEGAKTYMELALKYEESPSGVMLEHYGDILFHLGNSNEAIAYWKKAEGGEETSEFLLKKIKDKKYYD